MGRACCWWREGPELGCMDRGGAEGMRLAPGTGLRRPHQVAHRGVAGGAGRSGDDGQCRGGHFDWRRRTAKIRESSQGQEWGRTTKRLEECCRPSRWQRRHRRSVLQHFSNYCTLLREHRRQKRGRHRHAVVHRQRRGCRHRPEKHRRCRHQLLRRKVRRQGRRHLHRGSPCRELLAERRPWHCGARAGCGRPECAVVALGRLVEGRHSQVVWRRLSHRVAALALCAAKSFVGLGRRAPLGPASRTAGPEAAQEHGDLVGHGQGECLGHGRHGVHKRPEV
mmetsp:Transcript_124422/g.398473  ORF Transcript_124422/g.398473 Transcript_124422/m.398473 type:complete len:280 (+) Transcript_124422:472-1311(+)